MSLPDPQARIASLERELAWAHLKIQSLKEELRQFRVKLLGPKSETLNDLQLQLLADQEPGTTLDEVEAESQRAPLTKAPARARKPHPGRQRLPENLERVEEIVPCADQTCRECGAETALIGYDESEQLDVVPARHFVRVIKREKRACRCCEKGAFADFYGIDTPKPDELVAAEISVEETASISARTRSPTFPTMA